MAWNERASLLADSRPAPVSLTWQDLSYTVDEKVSVGFCRSVNEPKVLINHISGYVKPGQLLAIMGSSGAGKRYVCTVACLSQMLFNVTNNNNNLNTPDRVVSLSLSALCVQYTFGYSGQSKGPTKCLGLAVGQWQATRRNLQPRCRIRDPGRLFGWPVDRRGNAAFLRQFEVAFERIG
jgi:hypothetical protein